MTDFVNIKGKDYPLDKVIAISGLGPKGSFTKEQLQQVEGIETALFSDKVTRIIYFEFEGKKIAAIKPEKYKHIQGLTAPSSFEYSFLTNQLIKKLNTENTFIEPAPQINYGRHRDFNDNRRNFNNQPNRPRQHNTGYRRNDY